MKRYLIKEILLADTYERIALVKRLSDNKEIFVYFLSHDDYVTDIKEIKSIKKGDILEGRLLIVFVCESIKINDKVLFLLNHRLINLIKCHMNNL